MRDTRARNALQPGTSPSLGETSLACAVKPTAPRLGHRSETRGRSSSSGMPAERPKDGKRGTSDGSGATHPLHLLPRFPTDIIFPFVFPSFLGAHGFLEAKNKKAQKTSSHLQFMFTTHPH